MNEDPLKQNNSVTPLNTPEEASDTPSLAPEPDVTLPEKNDLIEPSAVDPTPNTAAADSEPAVDQPAMDQPKPFEKPTPELALPEHGSPDVPTSIAPASAPQKRSMWLMAVIIIVVGLAIAVGLAYVAYHIGNSRGYKNGKSAQTTSTSQAMLKVPDHATMVAQCTPGEGTQYVLPSNIPQGPIYNVWNNKVTGIEFMLGQSEITNSKTFNLSLMSQKYDHIDVMYEAAGHAGFTEPHYHIILSMIPYSQEQKITCGSSSSAMSSMNM